MHQAVKLEGGLVGMGSHGLHVLRQSLMRDAADHAPTILQEAGYAAGAEVYAAFQAWLAQDGIPDPGELDASVLPETLSEFFAALGWGTVSLERVGSAGLAVDAPAWAEAEQSGSEYPACFLSAGMLTDFLTRLSGQHVAVMEVECRTRGDGRCRFLVASPEALQLAYTALVEGRDYATAL